MDSVATWSDSLRSPRPIVWAEAMAAVSTTLKNLDARSLSMFSPNVLALTSGLALVAMSASWMSAVNDYTAKGQERESTARSTMD
jgi:hypothetical protein